MSRVRAAELGLAGVAVAATLSAGCGYALAGRGNTLPANVRIVGVPQFENQTGTAEIDRVVTEAVRAEFGSRGSLRATTEAAGADAVLRGTVTGLRLDASAFNASGQATRYAVTLTASVTFVNQRDNDAVLWSNPSLIFREEYDVPAGTTLADPAAFFRQDANALERLARNFSRSVVTSILESF